MNKNPLVTIITPTYNRANLLPETIDSILTQDYPNIEYIILDDGSTDNTEKLIKKQLRLPHRPEFVESISRNDVIFVSHKNMGETKTVNKGFRMAKGDIIAVVNSDDPLLPHAVSNVVDFFKKHPGISIAYPDWILIDETSKTIDTIRVEEYHYLKMVREHHCLPGPGTFFRRAVIEKIKERNQDFKYVGDFEFWLRAGLYFEMKRIPQLLASFRTHSRSQSQIKNDAMAIEHIKLVDKIFSWDNLPENIRPIRPDAVSSAYFHAATTAKSPVLRYLYYATSFISSPLMFGKKIKYELVKIKHRF